MRYFLCISYRGAGFSGWQIQENANTIEAEIEKTLSTLLSEPIDVVGAGRTDTGVNAKNFSAHFDTSSEELVKVAGILTDQTRLEHQCVGSTLCVTNLTVDDQTLVGIDLDQGTMLGSARQVCYANIRYFQFRRIGANINVLRDFFANRFTHFDFSLTF